MSQTILEEGIKFGTVRPSSERERVVRLLAVELHRQYRAAEKALNGPDKTDTNSSLKDGVTLRHDHGWEGCHKQAYFLRRAAMVIKRASCKNPETLGEAEQALDNAILIRRLIVEGKLPEPKTPICKECEQTCPCESHGYGHAAWDAEGGEVPAGKPYLVGEHSTDLGDTLTDAAKKSIRDAAVRGVLHGDKKFTFRTIFTQPKDGEPMAPGRVEVRTNAVAGNPTFRGVR